MVTPDDLIAPKGLVELFMFPGESRDNIASRLGAYIDEAVNRQGSSHADPATTAWAYYRAFTAVVLRLSTSAEKVDVTDEHSHSFGSKQGDRMKQLADEQLAEWNVLTAVTADAPSTPYGATIFKPTW